MYSWYVKPDEGAESLFLPKPGENQSRIIWGDDVSTKWPRSSRGRTVADRFLDLNDGLFGGDFAAPVISFSHFLPRQELMISTVGELSVAAGNIADATPFFNFSRFAGSKRLDRQIRRLGAVIHVYGHQHRNRDRKIDAVRYIAHCLGYPQERQKGLVRGEVSLPKLIWG